MAADLLIAFPAGRAFLITRSVEDGIFNYGLKN